MDVLTEIATLDAVGQAALVAAGEVRAVELVAAAIERIDRVDPELNAVVFVDDDAARRRAAVVDATVTRGPLAGVPLLVKDLLAYPGMRHAMGSRLFATNVATQHSPYTTALDDAGLITVGTTATSELGLLGSTETLLDGVTRNPWDRSRSAAGSSGGSAAAVAAGLTPLAHANDGGGSIRIPAAVCGVFGLKPSRGRTVPSMVDTGGLAALISDHVITRSVRDSAAVLAATEATGPDAPHPPIGHVTRPVDRPLRVGVRPTTLMGATPDAEVRSALDGVAALCVELGHEVTSAPAPPVDGAEVSQAFFVTAATAVRSVMQMVSPMLGREIGADDLEPFSLALVDWLNGLPDEAIAQAEHAKRRATDAYLRWIEAFDVVLSPTVPTPPWELGALAPTLDRATLIDRSELIAGYTAIHNMVGCPAMSVPLSTTADGMPLGSHFAARPGGEATLLGLAYQLELARPWTHRWPPVS